MIATPHATTGHHARLTPHVDRLGAIAELVGTAPAAQVRSGLDEASAFLNDMLIPHMEAAERTLYPELERLMQNRHSMTPMRREHQEIRALVADLDRRRATIGDHPISTGDSIVIRRGLYRLFGLLKVHLAEEQLYADIVEHGLSPEEAAALATALEHDGGGIS